MEKMASKKSMLRVILGTMEMGRRSLIEDQPCFEMLDTFIEKGHCEVDTALMYSGGESEKILGRYAKERGNSQNVPIATKANPWKVGLTRESVLAQAATSLASLQTSCVDIFYLHAPDHNTPIEETLAAVQQLYEEGKFKELGLSNYSSWEVADIYHICKRNGWVLPTVYQGMYNAITRMVEGELFPALRHFGLRFYAYNPLAGGILAGRYQVSDSETKPDGRFWSAGGTWTVAYRDRFWRDSVFKGVELVRKALEEAYGVDQVSMVSASFRWLNHHSQMKPEYNDGIIIGMSKMSHLVSNMEACEEGPLDERVVKAFDEAWQLDKGNCAKYYR